MIFGKKIKLTKLQKKEISNLNKQKKNASNIMKQVATTLHWLDIDEIQDDCIILKRDKKKVKLKGIKLSPHNIFLDDEMTQARQIEKLRICLNKCPSPMYHSFVYTPVTADEHIAHLLDADRIEEDLKIKSMLAGDFEKIYEFQDRFRELEFYIIIRDTEDKRLEKRFYDLRAEFQAAGFMPKVLNKLDYYNYCSYVFENSLINDYCFSRGVFSALNRNYIFDENNNQFVLDDRTENFKRFATDGEHIPTTTYTKMCAKSKLAPTSLLKKNDKYILGDKYVTNILVTQLPKTFYLGMLCEYVNNPRIKLFMTSEILDMNISAMLKKNYQEKLQQLRATRDPSLSSRLKDELDSLQDYIDDCIRNNDRTHDLTLVFSIYADDEKELFSMKKDLKQQLDAVGFKTTSIVLMQEMLLKKVCPLFIDSPIPKVIEENIGIPLPSDGLAGLYPYVFETLKDPWGFLLGREIQNNGIILFDPFFYLNNKEDSKKTQRVNGNMIVLGKSGAGKTTAMNIIIRHFISNKIKLVWVDPENKNNLLTKIYGGTYVKWGAKENRINIFDLKPIDTEDDEPDDNMWDTELSMFNVIEDLNQVISFLFPDIDENILSVTGDLAIQAYAKVNIKKVMNSDGKMVFGSFRNLKFKDMPTFSTFNECLLERIEIIKKDPSCEFELKLLNELQIKLRRILNEWSVYFNGHTTIDSNEQHIVSFGTKILFDSTPELRNALNHIMYKYAWALCLDDSERTAFILDEAHTDILQGSTAKLLEQFFRRSRKYWNVMLLGTQEPRDFADDKILTQGKAIFNNSVYKLLMHLDLDAVQDIGKLVNVNENEKILIQDFNQGEALFCCGNSRIPIMVMCTEKELIEMGG